MKRQIKGLSGKLLNSDQFIVTSDNKESSIPGIVKRAGKCEFIRLITLKFNTLHIILLNLKLVMDLLNINSKGRVEFILNTDFAFIVARGSAFFRLASCSIDQGEQNQPGKNKGYNFHDKQFDFCKFKRINKITSIFV